MRRPLTRGERRERRRLKECRHRISGRSLFTIARIIAARATGVRQQQGR
jgi:hypothetical protein